MPIASTVADQPPILEHATIRSIVIGIMLAMFLAALDQTIVATALPTIGRELGDLDAPALGGDGLSPERHRGDTALRQAQRHPRPAQASC